MLTLNPHFLSPLHGILKMGKMTLGPKVSFEIIATRIFNSIQILTAQEDDGGNYHSRGAIHPT